MAKLLGYGEPQILEVFKNTLPTKLYWILFPIEDLRQAVETVKRILTKEKLDKQLARQVFTSQIMSIREGASRRISFDTREELNDKINKLMVKIGKLAAKDSGRTRQFKPHIHQSRGRGQNRDYSQRNSQNRYRSDTDQTVGIEESSGKTEEDTDLGKVIEEVVSKIISEDTVDKILEESIGIMVTEMMATAEAGIGLEIDHFQEIMVVTELEVQTIVDQGHDPGLAGTG